MIIYYMGINLGFKWNHPDLTLDAGQFLKLASLIKAQHFQELLYIHLEWFGMCLCWCPHGDSNPGFSYQLESSLVIGVLLEELGEIFAIKTKKDLHIDI